MKIQIVQDIIDMIRGKKSYRQIKFIHTIKDIPRNERGKIISFNERIYAKGYYCIKQEDDMFIYSNNNISFYVSAVYPAMATEVFYSEFYKFHTDIDLNQKYTVFDIGANRGYASLYFAEKDWCKDVYAFELCEETANFAEKNIKLNAQYRDKISLFKYGLGDKKETIDVHFFKNRDGISSISKEFLENYAPKAMKNAEIKQYKVEKASTILKKIIEENKIDKIIIKIDAEGAEYEIMRDLVDNYPEIFDKIELLVGDSHLGFEKFINIFKNYGFKTAWKEEHSNGTCPFEILKDRTL